MAKHRSVKNEKRHSEPEHPLQPLYRALSHIIVALIIEQNSRAPFAEEQLPGLLRNLKTALGIPLGPQSPSICLKWVTNFQYVESPDSSSKNKLDQIRFLPNGFRQRLWLIQQHHLHAATCLKIRKPFEQLNPEQKILLQFIFSNFDTLTHPGKQLDPGTLVLMLLLNNLLPHIDFSIPALLSAKETLVTRQKERWEQLMNAVLFHRTQIDKNANGDNAPQATF